MPFAKAKRNTVFRCAWCQHCDQPIQDEGSGWYHQDTGDAACFIPDDDDEEA